MSFFCLGADNRPILHRIDELRKLPFNRFLRLFVIAQLMHSVFAHAPLKELVAILFINV